MSASTRNKAAMTCRWIGRIVSVALFLFWGAFFVEHVQEWLFNPQGTPPLWVWVSMLFHLGMLLGLVILLFREEIGMAVLVLSTVAFFATIGMNQFPWIALLNALPVALFLAARALDRKGVEPHPHPA